MTTPSPCQDRHLRRAVSAATAPQGSPGVDGAGEGQEPPVAPLGAVTFRVEGMAAAPQGSKTSFGNGVMRESCRNVKPWRAFVAHAAIAAKVPLFQGPVSMSVVFLFQRPANHYRRDGTLKPLNPSLASATSQEAPAYHCVPPDRDKILRSTQDALSGLAYEDDARVVDGDCKKRWCVGDERPGALITVIPLGGNEWPSA
jgi:Holliday junction resolvase RusA-like endonuclease